MFILLNWDRFTTDKKGSAYTQHQCQCCDVAGNMALIKLLRFLNKPNESLKNVFQPEMIRFDASVVANTPNQSLTLSVIGA